ncbi:MAG: hypothetical protein LBQ66_03365, partial [Planctomycetaceae bacterium]|nr:hypothetical protein [Planctomycetaceae bacterium]
MPTLGVLVSPMRLPLPLSASDNDLLATQPPGSQLPTLRLPTRLGVPFQLVRFYYTQRRAGRPRSSPLAASRQLSAVADVGRFGFTDAYWR